jgi:hypothetical protein
MTFFYISSLGHLISQKLRLLPRIPASEVQSQEPLTHNVSLPLPNPFKGMISKSTEHIPLKEQRDFGRVEVDQECDAGEILVGVSVSGLRIRKVDYKFRGLIWSEQELVVS